MDEHLVRALFMDSAEKTAKEAQRQVERATLATSGDAIGPLPEYLQERLVGQTAYTVGLEVGISIAVADGLAGRRLQEFLDHEFYDGNEAAMAAKTDHARAYLALLDQD